VMKTRVFSRVCGVSTAVIVRSLRGAADGR
jgi:hypothetical protein